MVSSDKLYDLYIMNSLDMCVYDLVTNTYKYYALCIQYFNSFCLVCSVTFRLSF